MEALQVQADPAEVEVEVVARKANAPDLWDHLWAIEGAESWRKYAQAQVFTRAERILRDARATRVQRAVDVGGGSGLFAARLQEGGLSVEVWDHSLHAVAMCREQGLSAAHVDLEQYVSEAHLRSLELEGTVLLATEVLEHLTAPARQQLLEAAKRASAGAVISVPNNRLGPEEEPQHTVKFTAMEFLTLLRENFECARVEVLGPYLLGVVGPLAYKPFTMSMTMPVRDEERDLEATLASFRAVADQIVIGVDPRTADRTREIAAQYADVVFEIENPHGPPDDLAPDGGVHFSWIRNQCIEKCTGDWIFMSEGHERLISGTELLLQLDLAVPPQTKTCFVIRTGERQQWGFEWLFRNDPRIRFTRKTHNTLTYPEGFYSVCLPQVRTLHERHIDRANARTEQRKVQNRRTLMEDWVVRGNEGSLFYLGSEWREYDEARAVERLEELLRLPAKNGPMRYHARLILAKTLWRRALKEGATAEQRATALAEVRSVLLGCTGEDWSRTEHWIWLGDLAFNEAKYEEALQFYRYAGTTVGEPPFTIWWIDLMSYTYIPAQRLAMCYGMLGRGAEALFWARRVYELLPDDSPLEVMEEARSNISILEEATRNGT